jgi:phosphoenolpyruvate carboxykinase (GTP)
LRIGAAAQSDPGRLPRLYMVNWFRKDGQGRFAWPGFGDNVRVLKWIVDRIEGDAPAVDTPIGRLPTADALDLEGLDLSDADRALLLSVDPLVWREEAALSRDYLAGFGDSLPPTLLREQEALEARLAGG